jgi:Xaa-Pro dipeptidase
LEVHETPSIHSRNELLMQPGMVFTIEPGIYIPEIGGVRIEDDVYIAEDGRVEVLTNYPKELRQLG